MLFSFPVLAGETAPVPQKDSLRKVLSRNQITAGIARQLEMAGEMPEADRAEALDIATGALSAARKAGSMSLELDAMMVIGRLNETPGNREAALPYYDSALVIARNLRDFGKTGEVLYTIGSIRRSIGDEASALEYFNEAIQACRQSDNFRVMAASYSLMGNIFRVNGLYDRAIESIVNSKLYYEKAAFSEGFAWSAYLLGRIYADLNLPDKAMENFNEALGIYNELYSAGGNGDGVAICYEQIGLLHMAHGRYEEALDFINRTESIYISSGSDYGITNSHKNLGLISFEMGRYDEAEEYLTRALVAKTELGDRLSLPSIYQYLGLLALQRGRREEGFLNLQKALDIARENNQTRLQLNIYSDLTQAYLGVKDLGKALESQAKQIEIQNLIISGAANIKIDQLQSIYEIDRQNTQILELERQNEINALTIKQNQTYQFLMITGALMALVIAVIILLSNRKISQKNRELREANAAKDKLFAIIAHDLRGPVSSISSFIAHLKSTVGEHSQDELEELLRSLSKSTGNLNSLLDNLLAWAKSQLNRSDFSPEAFSLARVIDESADGLRQWADSKQIDIHVETDPGIEVSADIGMVSAVLRNLLSNSIKFSHRGGSISVLSKIERDRAVISVKDTGVGIDEESQEKLFDITNTYYTRGTEDEKSTGLGLILVREFVERNGGTVSIHSRRGTGTTVSFSLPLSRGNGG